MYWIENWQTSQYLFKCRTSFQSAERNRLCCRMSFVVPNRFIYVLQLKRLCTEDKCWCHILHLWASFWNDTHQCIYIKTFHWTYSSMLKGCCTIYATSFPFSFSKQIGFWMSLMNKMFMEFLCTSQEWFPKRFCWRMLRQELSSQLIAINALTAIETFIRLENYLCVVYYIYTIANPLYSLSY